MSRATGRLALAALLTLAAAQYGWNSFALPPTKGYDAPGHAGYALTIRKGRLPEPYDGWSTHHPPLYYLLAGGAWALVEPLGPRALAGAMRAIGGLALIAGAAAVHALVARLAGSAPIALVATALFLFVPCAQMAAAMAGNEALGAGLAALALPGLVRLQADPRSARTALAVGIPAGLALVTKYTGLFLAAACVVPFLRRDLDRASLRALAIVAISILVIAGPWYARNVALTGSPFPVATEREPLRSADAFFVVRPRHVVDYVRLDAAVLSHPLLYAAPPAPPLQVNPAMLGVWNMVYAGIWYDVFGERILEKTPPSEARWLLVAGLAPTALVLLGMALAARAAWRARGRSADAPLLAMIAVGLVVFVAWTWRAPSLVGTKASYLLPLAGPAAVFFARGMGALRPAGQAIALAACAIALALAIALFTDGMLFRARPPSPAAIALWRGWAWQLPDSSIEPALTALLAEPAEP